MNFTPFGIWEASPDIDETFRFDLRDWEAEKYSTDDIIRKGRLEEQKRENSTFTNKLDYTINT